LIEEIVMKHCPAGLIAMLILATGVQAQPPIGSYTPPQVNPNPAFSPYLNLNRGNNPAINYYGVVRPQVENQQAIQQLQQQFQGTQAMMPGQGGPLATEDIGPTGHRLGGFFNYSHYYPLFYAGGGGAGVPAVAGPGYGGAGFAGPGAYGQGIYGTGYGQGAYGFIR
jgi:hypothetical protein